MLVLLALFFPAPVARAADAAPPGPADATAAAPRWRLLRPPVKPTARGDTALAYDTSRGVAVLFGGATQDGFVQNDTWLWDSALGTWSLVEPVHRPPARAGHSLVYDQARGVTVLFGGVTNSAEEFGDTWLWDGTDWQEMAVPGPDPRWLAGMTYDSQRQVVVLYGGDRDSGKLDDTWLWDGQSWSQQPVAGPGGRSGVALSYDSGRNVTVLYGGNTSIEFFRDTWEWTGSGDWQLISSSRSPSARSRMGAAYFPELQRSVIFGGLKLSAYYDDTFVWDGLNWRTRLFDPRPAGRCCVGMVYDPVLRGVLLFGGSVSWVASDETWLFR